MTNAETNHPEKTPQAVPPAATPQPESQPDDAVTVPAQKPAVKPLTANTSTPVAAPPEPTPEAVEAQPVTADVQPAQAQQQAVAAPVETVQPTVPEAVEPPADDVAQPLPETSNSRVTAEVAAVATDVDPEVEGTDSDTPEHYFLVHPSNEAVIAGESRNLPDMGSRIVLLVGLPLLLVGIGLIVMAVLRWMTIAPLVWASATAPPNTILNGVLWTVGAFLFNVFVVGWFSSALGRVMRRRGLKKRGQLVWGEVITAVGKRDRAGDLFVTVDYQFREPRRRRKKMILGSVTEKRNDLKQQALPTPETPVAVLYLHPKNHEIL